MWGSIQLQTSLAPGQPIGQVLRVTSPAPGRPVGRIPGLTSLAPGQPVGHILGRCLIASDVAFMYPSETLAQNHRSLGDVGYRSSGDDALAYTIVACASSEAIKLLVNM